MTPTFRLLILAGVSITAPGALWSAAELVPANVTVARSLQASASIKLGQAAPDGGLPITLTSSDPGRVLLAKSPDHAGSPSITITAPSGHRESPEFWVHGLADSGAVSYTAAAPGFGAGKGTVTLAPSGIVVAGPFRVPKFPTTTGAPPSKITVFSVLLDSSMKIVEQQAVAGEVEVVVTSSDPRVGVLSASPVTIPGGFGHADLEFRPAGAGETAIAVTPPPGFSAPAESAAITAMVAVPGLALTDQVAIGRDLQLGGIVSLGAPAPAGGLAVILSSSDPHRLLLSSAATQRGSQKVEIKIPAGGTNSSYFLQALSDAGTVTYTATAPGYRSRTATVTLAPSGVLITPAEHGPPDEAEVLRPHDPTGHRAFVTDLASGRPVPIMVWTAQLDPATKRGADITVQPLRAGLSITVPLKNSNPAVGTVGESVTIKGGAEHAATNFAALSKGSTVISAATPAGFTTPSNATSVTAVVAQ